MRSRMYTTPDLVLSRTADRIHRELKKDDPIVSPIPMFVYVMKRDIIEEKNCGRDAPAANNVLLAIYKLMNTK